MTDHRRAVFLGSGAFAVPVAEALRTQDGVDLVAVVTAPTRPGSRGRPTDPPVADWAKEHGLPMLRPERLRTEESIGAVAELLPDILVLADYGQIVPAALLDDLAATMRAAPGVGLTAPQMGVALQACVIEVENQLHELVNPKIVKSTGDDTDLEGCLSIPGYIAYVTLREHVWVVAQNRLGRKIKLAGTGLLSRAMQHELDHLQGKLYIDYLDSMEELIPVAQMADELEAEEEELAPLA